MSFKPNLSTTDRIIRTLVGIGCIYVGFIDQNIITNNIISILVGIFGIVNIVAAVISHCPVYGLAGFSTCAKDKDNS